MEGEGERERGRKEREGECVCACVCVDGFIVGCPRSPTPLLYTLRLGRMIRLGVTNIHLHYITL